MRHKFTSREALIEGFVAWCLNHMEHSVNEFGSANVLLSGGGTPGPAYAKLNEDCSFLDAVHFGLVDERFVEQSSEFSNERLIRTCFSNSPEENIKGMVFNLDDQAENLHSLHGEYNHFSERTDLVILGMGPDGHTASIFPNDSASNNAMKVSEPFLNTNSPAHPTNRITCSLDLISKAKAVVLLITGANKLEVLENITLNLPIHTTLQTCPNIQIFYSE